MAEAKVVNINGVDYKEEDLQDNSKYFIAQIKDLQTQKAQIKFKLDQVDAALSVMTNQLIESVKQAEDKFTEASKFLDQRKKVYQSLFEPEEFETLVKLMDTIQKASFIKGRSESATYGFQQIRKDLEDQSRGKSGKLADAVLNLLNLITPRAARDTFKQNTADQTERLMIDMLTSAPENLDTLNEAINVVLPYLYASQQATTRGVREIRREEDENVMTQDDVIEELQERDSNLQSQLDSALESFTPSNIPIVPPANAVTPDAMLSETVLPNPDDREIARRLMTGRGGIGSLA